jgi:uncharacterized protein YigE (DUF2233 family)
MNARSKSPQGGFFMASNLIFYLANQRVKTLEEQNLEKEDSN